MKTYFIVDISIYKSSYPQLHGGEKNLEIWA